MPSSDPNRFESKFPELKIPEHGWESTIPKHLLENCDPQMEYLLNEVSKNTQATNFACQGVHKISNHLRELNGRVHKSATKIERSEEEIETLKNQAKAVSPFLKPISMLASLWEYPIFKYFFVGGVLFFLFVLYPYLLKIGLLELLDSFIKGH